MKYLVLGFLLMFCFGCTDASVKAKRSEKERELFVECMQLAADLPRDSDDRVYKIIDECRIYAYLTVD